MTTQQTPRPSPPQDAFASQALSKFSISYFYVFFSNNMNECLALLLVPTDGDTGAAGEGHMMTTGGKRRGSRRDVSRFEPHV